MERNPVGWFEIYTEDLDRAKSFYEAVLDVELTKLESPTTEIEMLAFPMSMESKGASGALANLQGFKPTGNGTLVYFTCEDCAVEASRVDAAGGQLERAKMSIGPYGFVAIAIDTEGNRIGLHSLK